MLIKPFYSLGKRPETRLPNVVDQDEPGAIPPLKTTLGPLPGYSDICVNLENLRNSNLSFGEKNVV